MKTIILERVVHVGTMDISRKNGGSLEGTGLSISLCPSAWQRITRTEGKPHLLEKAGGGTFLLATSLTQEDKEAIADWGIENGYVEKVVSYVKTYYDDEYEEEFEIVYDTREEAERDLDEGETIEERADALQATDKMVEVIGEKPPIALVFDLLTTIYAEQNGYDGVYWKELLDVSRLSAPRGVIANSKLKEWSVKVLEKEDHFFELPEDEECYYPDDEDEDEFDWEQKGIDFHSWASMQRA